MVTSRALVPYTGAGLETVQPMALDWAKQRLARLSSPVQPYVDFVQRIYHRHLTNAGLDIYACDYWDQACPLEARLCFEGTRGRAAERKAAQNAIDCTVFALWHYDRFLKKCLCGTYKPNLVTGRFIRLKMDHLLAYAEPDACATQHSAQRTLRQAIAGVHPDRRRNYDRIEDGMANSNAGDLYTVLMHLRDLIQDPAWCAYIFAPDVMTRGYLHWPHALMPATLGLAVGFFLRRTSAALGFWHGSADASSYSPSCWGAI